MLHPARMLCALSLAVASALVSAPAFACSCVFPSIEAARADAAALFEGRVVSITNVKGDAGAESAEHEVLLDVVRSWKGLEKNERVSVRTAASSAQCGVTFAKGTSYLIYAAQEAGTLAVNACGRTRPLADAAEDLAALGSGATPVTVTAKSLPDAGTPLSPIASLDAGASVKPVAKSGGCASTRGQASLAPYLLALPALMLRAGRRKRPGDRG